MDLSERKNSTIHYIISKECADKFQEKVWKSELKVSAVLNALKMNMP
jgi:hypothetical protein